MPTKTPKPQLKSQTDTPPIEVWPLFLTSHAVLIEAIEARLAAADLPPLGWYDVLWALERAEDGRVRLSDLAGRLVISRSNMTRLVDRLEQAGFVERERSEEDGRGAYARLTNAGKTQRAKMWPVYREAITELFAAHLQPAEARAMKSALQRILSEARS